jgi:hypothetical protein
MTRIPDDDLWFATPAQPVSHDNDAQIRLQI